MVRSPYVECPSCRFILNDSGMTLSVVEEPCPKCGTAGEVRSIWPSITILKFLEIVTAQDLEERDGMVVAAVFLATAYEAAFEHVIWRLVAQRSKDTDTAEAVMDELRGIDRRLKFFRTMTKVGVDEVWSDPALNQVGPDWNSLRTKRNKVAHGLYYFTVTKDHVLERELVRRLQTSFLPAFATLENHVQTWMATRPGGPPAGAPGSTP